MRHRRLDAAAGQQLAALEDIISRGLWKDWEDLRLAALDGTERICQAFVHDRNARRHHFWPNHVRHRRGAA